MRCNSAVNVLMIFTLVGISIGLSGCRDDEAVASDKKKPASTQAYLQSLIKSDGIYCGRTATPGAYVPKKYLAAWALDKAPAPYNYVDYRGKNTPQLSDDILHATEMYYFPNSSNKVRSGKEQAQYVSVVRHIVYNEKGRYQWIEDADQTLADIKTMSSIRDGWNMRDVEDHLMPSFVARDRLIDEWKDTERGAYLYAFDIWADNMKEADEPNERVKNCRVSDATTLMAPPELSYTTFEDIWENYKDSSDPVDVNMAVASLQFSTLTDPIQFPIQVMYGSRPGYKPK